MTENSRPQFLKTFGLDDFSTVSHKEAIAYAIDHGKPGDIIVLAGKGHEDYQEIKGVKHHMDERELIADILKERGISF